MKKILFILTILLASLNGFTQGTASVSPSSFTAEDQITITFDLTGLALGSSNEDVYIWGFVPGCCGSPLNDQGGFGWNNSNPAAKLTRIGTTQKFTYTLTPTTYMNKTAAQIGAQFGCLAKNQNGSRQTNPDFIFAVDPLTFTPAVFRPFPSKFTQDDVVTFFMDKNLLNASKVALKAATEVYVYTDIDYKRPDGSTGFFQVSQYCEPLDMGSGDFYTGQTTVADNVALKAKDFGNGVFGWTIVPSKFFRIGDAGPRFPPAGSTITKIKVHFRTRLSPYCPFTTGDSGSLGDNFGFPVTQ